MDRRKDKEVLTELAHEEPQVIAEINIKPMSEDDRRAQFLESVNHCPLCGSELFFTHNTDFGYWLVEEEAHCPSCNIRTNKENHSLQ